MDGASSARARRGRLGQPYLPEAVGAAPSPLEQVVIQQELQAANGPPALMIAAWVVPSLVAVRHARAAGTVPAADAARRDHLVPAVLRAGRRLRPGGAATRAERVEGGWKITGQKIWTSLARDASGASASPAPTPTGPKHEGITYFLVDMTSPGIDVRPLRECTGDAVFNEVFLDGVFVPDDLVVGPGQRRAGASPAPRWRTSASA